MLRRQLRPLVCLLGGALGFVLGCSIVAEPTLEPCEHGANNYIDSAGMCQCRAGYERCDPDDPMNLDCCESGGTGTDGTGTETGFEQFLPCESGMNNQLDENGDCQCQVGYEWCDPSNPEDLNCCVP